MSVLTVSSVLRPCDALSYVFCVSDFSRFHSPIVCARAVGADEGESPCCDVGVGLSLSLTTCSALAGDRGEIRDPSFALLLASPFGAGLHDG